MKKNLGVISAAALVGAVGVFVVDSAVAKPRGDLRYDTPAAHDSAQLFTLEQPKSQTGFLDVGDKGRSYGDTLFFNGPLLERSGGRQVAMERGACETVDAKTGSLHCYVTYTFGGSQKDTIEASGAFPLAPDGSVTKTDVFAVTGGTGKFSGAVGEVRITNLSADGSVARQTFVLNRYR